MDVWFATVLPVDALAKVGPRGCACRGFFYSIAGWFSKEYHALAACQFTFPASIFDLLRYGLSDWCCCRSTLDPNRQNVWP